jgi:hypothetical protein
MLPENPLFFVSWGGLTKLIADSTLDPARFFRVSPAALTPPPRCVA